MKKKIAALAAAAFVLTGAAVGFAAVDKSAVSLGGIAPGDELTAVRAKYPNIRQIDDDSYSLGNGFVVEVSDRHPGIVEEVKVYNGNNSIETPAGITVGTSAFALNDAYGKADKVDKDRYDTEYTYFTADRSMQIEFKVIDGVITKITCELRD